MKTISAMFGVLPICLLLAVCIHKSTDNVTSKAAAFDVKLKSKTAALKKYAGNQKASTSLGILIDMSMPSWKNRFFVVDLNTDSVLVKGIVAHGMGNDYTREEVVFSNVPGSYCSSEGRYKLGYKYKGDYGWAYKLNGLDTSNSKAFERYVVFHYYSCVPDFEDEPVCRSQGCPMVSENTFNATAKLIDASKKPVLMWIYK